DGLPAHGGEVGQLGPSSVAFGGVDEAGADLGIGQGDHGVLKESAREHPGGGVPARERPVSGDWRASTPAHAEQASWAAPLPAGVVRMPSLFLSWTRPRYASAPGVATEQRRSAQPPSTLSSGDDL